jgi:hypothetical protein
MQKSVRLVYKPFVLICTADLLGEKNTIPCLISRLIMAAEQSLSQGDLLCRGVRHRERFYAHLDPNDTS